MIVGLIYVLFRKVSVHILCPLLNGLVCFFPVNLLEFFANSGYQPFVRWVNCKNFFPFCWLPIHSNDCFFRKKQTVQKLWSLIGSHLSILAFVASAFGVLVIKFLPTPMS